MYRLAKNIAYDLMNRKDDCWPECGNRANMP